MSDQINSLKINEINVKGGLVRVLEPPFRWQKGGLNQCDAKWTESIAVGDKEFVMETEAKLGAKAMGRKTLGNSEGYELRENQNSYNQVFASEKCSLRLKNDRFWRISQ